MEFANQPPTDNRLVVIDQDFEALRDRVKKQQERLKRMQPEMERRFENAIFNDNDKINSCIQKIEKVSKKLEKTGLKLMRGIERFDKLIAQRRRGPKDEDFERAKEELGKSKEFLVVVFSVINSNESLIKTLRKGLYKGNSVNNPAKVEQNLETRRKLKKTKSLLTSVNRFVGAVAKSVSRVSYRITSFFNH